jgi:hypothetical protein
VIYKKRKGIETFFLFLNLILGFEFTINTHDDTVISLEGLKCDLLQRLQSVALHLLDLGGEDNGRGERRVDAVGLDGDDEVAVVLEEVLRVDGEDALLVRLRDVHEDDVDHRHQHAVLDGRARVLDDGDDVGAALAHLDEIAARAVGELDGVDGARRADDVGDVRDGRARRAAEVQDLAAGRHVDRLDAAVDGGRELRAVRVPHAVLLLLGVVLGDALGALLAVDGDAGDHVEGREGVGLGRLGDEDAGVAHVGRDDDLGAAAASAAATAAAATWATATSAASSAEATASSAATTAVTSAKSTAATTEATTTTITTTEATSSAHFFIIFLYKKRFFFSLKRNTLKNLIEF